MSRDTAALENCTYVRLHEYKDESGCKAYSLWVGDTCIGYDFGSSEGAIQYGQRVEKNILTIANKK